jgi:hypothetical protein
MWPRDMVPAVAMPNGLGPRRGFPGTSGPFPESPSENK